MHATAQQPLRAPHGASAHYESHRSEQTTLNRLSQQHPANFSGQTEGQSKASTGSELPRSIKADLHASQECGILARGARS